MTLEGLSYFGIYRMIAPYSPKYTHSYRAGIFVYLMFGACGFHVPVCALVFLIKHGLPYDSALKYASFFLLPATVLFFIVLAVLQIAQIKAFLKCLTPCPKYCALFSVFVGMAFAMLLGAFGNFAFTNALSCAWIAFGNLWMFCGLLAAVRKIKE